MSFSEATQLFPDDLVILNVALALEHEAIAAYAQRELLIQDGVIATDRKRSEASAVT